MTHLNADKIPKESKKLLLKSDREGHVEGLLLPISISPKQTCHFNFYKTERQQQRRCIHTIYDIKWLDQTGQCSAICKQFNFLA